MAKKRKKSEKAKSRKAGKPDSAAGIGRELRDAVQPVIRLASSPIASELIATALIAGAGALAKSNAGDEAARTIESQAGALIEGAEEAGRKGTDLAALVTYSVAVAAGEIAARLAASYERQVGSSGTAEHVAKAARKAADAAWVALGKEQA